MSTVNKWFDTGQLKGFRVPGSRHRRIPQADLVRFLQEHGIPCDHFDLEEEEARVLIVSPDVQLSESLANDLSESSNLSTLLVHSSFDAGIQAESFRPDCVIVDFAIGADEARRICQHLRSKSGLGEVVLIAVSSDGQWDGEELGFLDDAFQAPFDPALLTERIRSLVRSRLDTVS